MKPYRIAILISLIIVVFAETGSAESKAKKPGKTTNSGSDIRKVDFKNFNYGPVCPGKHEFLPIKPSDRLVLRRGHVELGDELNNADLGSVKYLDFDGDGKEEAFGIINGQTSGSSNKFLGAYGFAFRNGAARQIWSRCEEGSAAELKGRSIFFTHPEWVGNDAHCCPSYFTTDVYRWNGSRIARISRKRKKSD